MLLTQRNGVLWKVRMAKAEIKGTPEVLAVGQGGLLEVAPHPDYNKNGWIYLSYSQDARSQSRWEEGVDDCSCSGPHKNNKWVDQENIFMAPPKFHTTKGGHYGSRFVFKDGYLFFSIGDRQEGDPAQDLTVPHGKVHRIYDDGRVPKDNPFYNTSGAYKTIWAYGNRNPQGMDMHPLTEDYGQRSTARVG